MKSLQTKSLSKMLSIILNIIWWIEWIGSGILITVILITWFLGKNILLNFPLTFSSVTFKTVPSVNKGIPAGVINVMNGNFYLSVDNNWQNILMLLAASIAICTVFIVITHQLKLIFRSLINNQPFSEPNVVRIRNIGIVLIVFSFLQFLSNIILNRLLLSHFNWEEIKLTYSFKISYLLTGVILIIVAEIFNEGVSLKEETNLTI
jgi:Protein of unknown function (DUF2975)